MDLDEALERVADPRLDLGGLLRDQRGDPDRRVEDPLPQLVRGRDRRLELEVRHADLVEPGALEQLAQLLVGLRKLVGPSGRPGGGGASADATASSMIPSSRFRCGASHVDSASQPPDRRTRRDSASAASGRPTWLNTKLPTTASNAPAPAGIASNEPSRNGIEGWVIAARRTIDGATSMPTVSAPSAAAAAARSPGPDPTSSTCRPGPTSASPSTVPPTRRVIGDRNPYEPARSSQPAASNRLKASASMARAADPSASPAPPSG